MDRRVLTNLNWPLLGLTLILFGIGIVNLYSASGFRLEEGLAINAYYNKQIIWGSVGIVFMIFFTLFDYKNFRHLAWPLFIMSVLLLAAVPIWGVTIYGAKRWLSFGYFNFQPSEFAKISVLLLGAKILSKKSNRLDLVGLFYVMGLCSIPALLVIKQPDLGSGLNLLLLLSGIILYRGLTARVLKTMAVVLPMLMPLGWFLLKDYQKRRIMTFLNPGSDPLGDGYNIIQSQIAIGSGEIWGKGFLAGTQSQLRFLPEKHTDFAFAVFGEEWGFIGTITLLALFCFFLLSIVATARDSKDRFGSFLAAGVFFYFFWQILINMGMVLGLMPVVGIPLPFISYGGSATIVNFCLVGLVLSISMRRFAYRT